MRLSPPAMCAPYLALEHHLLHLDRTSPNSSALLREPIWRIWACPRSSAALSRTTAGARATRQEQRGERQERVQKEGAVSTVRERLRMGQLPTRASFSKHLSPPAYHAIPGL